MVDTTTVSEKERGRKVLQILFGPAQSGPNWIGVVYLGQKGCSSWSLGTCWALLEHFLTSSLVRLEKILHTGDTESLNQYG